MRSSIPGYGADLSAPVWNDYMSVAATDPCDDFPAPEDPAELSSFYSDSTASFIATIDVLPRTPVNLSATGSALVWVAPGGIYPHVGWP